MRAPMSYLVALPVEILERTLLCLPGRDIVRMQEVSRLFRDVVRTSPTLQHRCELFAIGMIENPVGSCSLAERRKLHEEYVRRWSDATGFVKSTHELPPSQCSSGWLTAKYSGNGLFVAGSNNDTHVAFLLVPPVASQKPIEGWSIPSISLPGRISRREAYLPENVVAVSEGRERSIHIHLLNLRDGSPHPTPTSNVITWEPPPGSSGVGHASIAITGSRIMMYVSYFDESARIVRRIVVWNWKTGELVLDFSSTTERGSIKMGTQAIFLDEFCLAVMPEKPAITELVVFNTLVPQDRPGYLRRLAFPPEFHKNYARIRVDYDRDLGTPNEGEGLIPDPAQAVLVVDFWRDEEPRVFLVLRTQVLAEQVYSVHADSHVPWDEWGRDAVTIETQFYDHDFYPVRTFVRGVRVTIAEQWPANMPGCYHLRTFDLSQRGRRSLPLQSGVGGTERVLFIDGVNLSLDPHRSIGLWDELQPLGDGSLSLLRRRTVYHPNSALEVWELR